MMTTKSLAYPLLILTLLVGCGKLGNVDHTGTVKTEISVNEAQLRYYFNLKCLQSNPGLTVDQLKLCSDLYIADFLAAIANAGK
jgi:hypothetical protein